MRYTVYTLADIINEPLAEAEATEALTRDVDSDPLEWFKRKGIQLYAKQREIVSSALAHPRTNVVSANGTGKSFLVSAFAAWHVARYKQRGKVVLIAPSARQLRTNLLPHVGSFLVDEPGVSPLRDIVRVGNHVALQSVALSAYLNTSTGLGAHAEHLLVILEEASGITPPMYRQIMTYTSGRNGRVLAIGNPFAGSLAEGWSTDASWYTMNVSAFDTPAFTHEDGIPQSIVDQLTSLEFVETVKADYGEDSEEYRSAVLGLFTDISNMLYFSPAGVATAFANYDDVSGLALGQPTLGVDVAGAGADENCVYAMYPVLNPQRIRFVVRDITTQEIRKCPDPKTTGVLVTNLAKSVKASRIRIDSLGPGADTVAQARMLLQDRLPVDGINTGRPAGNPVRYLNRRAELAATLRVGLNAGVYAIQPSAKLKQEILAFHRVPPSASREVLELKKNVKQRIGRSPDRFDSLNLAVTPSPTMAGTVPF